jgi:hypothetical protein
MNVKSKTIHKARNCALVVHLSSRGVYNTKDTKGTPK